MTQDNTTPATQKAGLFERIVTVGYSLSGAAAAGSAVFAGIAADNIAANGITAGSLGVAGAGLAGLLDRRRLGSGAESR